jgi:carbonic anhydrase/acetyltransferase-like protein (isoleucine patch superfamily)
MTLAGIRTEYFCLMQQVVALFPDVGKLSGVRTWFYRSRLGRCGQRVTMMSGCKIFCPQAVFIGDDVGVNLGVVIDACDGGRIEIGNSIGIGPYCVLRAADHGFADPNVTFRKQPHVPGTIVIEDDVWLGSHVVVTRNVRIGRGSVIGAHSVVTKDIPPYSVAAGVPARVIKSRQDGQSPAGSVQV